MKLKTVNLVMNILLGIVLAIIPFTFLMPVFAEPVAVVILTVLTLAALVLNAIFWRCPDCGRGLGKRWSIAYCPHCGARLEI